MPFHDEDEAREGGFAIPMPDLHEFLTRLREQLAGEQTLSGDLPSSVIHLTIDQILQAIGFRNVTGEWPEWFEVDLALLVMAEKGIQAKRDLDRTTQLLFEESAKVERLTRILYPTGSHEERGGVNEDGLGGS